jgi:hypothetical protein
MKEIKFPDWNEALARAGFAERRKTSFEITVRWYLNFCRRSRAGVNVGRKSQSDTLTRTAVRLGCRVASLPRKPRIQYSGAFYHVMKREDHQEAIFRDPKDREMFLKTLREACEKTG